MNHTLLPDLQVAEQAESPGGFSQGLTCTSGCYAVELELPTCRCFVAVRCWESGPCTCLGSVSLAAGWNCTEHKIRTREFSGHCPFELDAPNPRERLPYPLELLGPQLDIVQFLPRGNIGWAGAGAWPHHKLQQS